MNPSLIYDISPKVFLARTLPIGLEGGVMPDDKTIEIENSLCLGLKTSPSQKHKMGTGP